VTSTNVNKAILNYFNSATKSDDLVRVIIDDPRTGKLSNRAYGMRDSVAKKILEKRNDLPNKKFTSIDQIRSVRGVGIDTLNDIYFAFNMKALLDENNDSNRTKVDKDTIVKEINESLDITNAVRKNFTKRQADRMKKVRNRTKIAENAFKRFDPSLVPINIRKDPTYLGPKDNLKDCQQKIVERTNKIIKNSKIKPSLRLSFTENELKDLGFRLNSDGTIGGQADLQKILKKVDSSSQGNEFYTADSLIEMCKNETDAKKMVDDATTLHTNDDNNSNHVSSTSTADTSLSSSSTNLTNDELIGEKIALQMKHATAPENELKFNVQTRPDQNQITENISKLEFGTALSDLPSYHDFHNIRIAFEHVWTEVYDEQIPTLGKQLYEQWVNYKDEGLIDEEEEEKYKTITTTDELRRFRDDILAFNEKIAGEDERFTLVKLLIPEISLYQWSLLDGATQDAIYSLAKVATLQPVVVKIGDKKYTVYEPTEISPEKLEEYRETARAMLRAAKVGKLSRLEKFLEDIDKRLKEPHAFKVFAPNSINFGILINYKQKWTPLNYQVGELVSSIPLTPGEIRKYTKKSVIKKSRSEKEIEDSLQVRKIDSSNTSRFDSEIVSRAINKTNFQLNSEGGINTKVFKAKYNSAFTVDSTKESAETKKSFREAVMKASQEYKNNHKMEIETKESEELEETFTAEIHNSNDELVLICLFYELQRRYKINEKLHKVTPVVLVANHVPAPHLINEAWLLSHEWILRRVILDDSFLNALDYLNEDFAGKELAIEVLRGNVERQSRIVEAITEQVTTKSDLVSTALDEVETKIEERAKGVESGGEGILSSAVDFVFGGGGNPEQAAAIREEAAKEVLQRLQQEANQLRERLRGEVTILSEASEKYSEAMQEHFDRRIAIDKLRIHIKENILYYMQAIWDHEPPDQRLFRLYDLEVPMTFDPTVTTIKGEALTRAQSAIHHFTNTVSSSNNENNNRVHTFDVPLPPWTPKAETQKLIEIADIDNLLGYKGNYMIFPLHADHYIINYMMQDFVDQTFGGIHDPDEFADYTTDELVDLMKCVYEKDPDVFTDEVKKEFQDLIKKRLTSPRTETDVVVVPTDSLYIEALPGKHPILEDFKLIHRAVDVKKVQADTRKLELDNIRRAAKILKGELEDPETEKEISIKEKETVKNSSE